MAYEDTVRVAELKIRPSRFARVRAEVQAADGQIIEIAEFLHPRVEEIADTLPVGLGRWLLNTGWPRRLVERYTKAGRVVKTSTIRGFLLMYFIASLKPTRRRSLRFANEQKFLTRVAPHHPDRSPRPTTRWRPRSRMTRTLVKGYSDTHERGRRNYDTLMQMLPRIMETPDPAATLRALAQGRAGRRHRRGAQRRDPRRPPAAAGGGVATAPPPSPRSPAAPRARTAGRPGPAPSPGNCRPARRGRLCRARAGRRVFVHVEHVPGQPHDVLGPGAALGQHRDDVLQRLPRLRDEALREFLAGVPADHAADEDELAARLDAVGVALRRRPAGRLQRFVLG